MQAINLTLKSFCQQHLGMKQVPDIEQQGIELVFERSGRLQIFLQNQDCWLILELHQANNQMIAEKLETLDTPMIYIQAFLSTKQKPCLAVKLSQEGLNELLLRQAVDQLLHCSEKIVG